MLGRFIAEEGPEKGHPLLLQEGEIWIIGRDSSTSNLVIRDPKVSRSHAQCTLTSEGWTIENLSETNPITHNETPITTPTLLKEGDRLKIGSFWYTYTEEEPTPTHEEEELSEEEPAPTHEEEELSEEELSEEEPAPTHEEEELSEEELSEEEPAPTHEEEELSEEEPTEDLETVTIIEDDLAEQGEDSRNTIFKEIEDDDFENLHFDLAESSRWMLKVIGGPNAGAEFSMEENRSYTLGTDSQSCDILFNDRSVSRQHAKISIENEQIHIEDLQSSNGTFIEDQRIETPSQLDPNQVVFTGTTSFIILDREAALETIISPTLTPSSEEEKTTSEEEIATPSEETTPSIEQEEITPNTLISQSPFHKTWLYITSTSLKFVLPIAFIIFLILFFSITGLFSSKEVQLQNANYAVKIETALKNFPDVKYTYNPKNGKLFLMGHVLTGIRHKELLYNLDQLKVIQDVEDHTVIDEGVWQEMNFILNKIEKWKGISAHSPEPGVFVVNGYLKTRLEFEDLNNYINLNFSFLDRLQNRVVIEEDIIDKTSSALFSNGFVDVILQVNNGEVTLTGFIPTDEKEKLDKVVKTFNEIYGVRNVKNFVVELTKTNISVINLSNISESTKDFLSNESGAQTSQSGSNTGGYKYNVTGSSFQKNAPVNVIINGRILTKGDKLDGMTITDVERRTVYLEKDGVKYKIDYNN